MPKRLIFWSIIAIVILVIVLVFVIGKAHENNTHLNIDKSKWNEDFDTEPLLENQIPIIEIVNQTFSKTGVELEKNGRIKFTNKDNQTYTLMIPEIGIEEELLTNSVFEPTFYKEGKIEFWLKEIGYNETKGIVNVSIQKK